jgi:SAM-dependent methyltransferase
MSRSLSFGAVAADYDRYRPSYPPALVADVCALLPGRRILEIGAGTGIATSQFADYGLDITAVEPDPSMAAVLADKFIGDDDVRVTVATFERWSAERGAAAPSFDGLICAQAWHWTTPDTRWRDAAAALASGGVLALIWNRDGYADPEVRTIINQVYDQHGIDDRPMYLNDDAPVEWPAEEVAASVGFTDREVRRYAWSRRQTVADQVARFNTVSAHLILPPDVRQALSNDLLAALTAHAGAELDLAMTTDLVLARRE